MQTKMLLPTISRSTRIALSSSTLIDNTFVNNFDNIISGIFTIDITDQIPIFLKHFNYFSTESIHPNQNRYRLANETTLNKLYHG